MVPHNRTVFSVGLVGSASSGDLEPARCLPVLPLEFLGHMQERAHLATVSEEVELDAWPAAQKGQKVGQGGKEDSSPHAGGWTAWQLVAACAHLAAARFSAPLDDLDRRVCHKPPCGSHGQGTLRESAALLAALGTVTTNSWRRWQWG